MDNRESKGDIWTQDATYGQKPYSERLEDGALKKQTIDNNILYMEWGRRLTSMNCFG